MGEVLVLYIFLTAELKSSPSILEPTDNYVGMYLLSVLFPILNSVSRLCHSQLLFEGMRDKAKWSVCGPWAVP